MPSITLTVTAAQAQRIATAFGRAYNLRDANNAPRDATGPEIHDYIVGYVRNVVTDTEGAAARAAIQVSDLGGIT